MRLERRDEGVVIFLDEKEVKELCRPGAGADTCIWLVCGENGFECINYNRQVPNLLGESLEDRWRRGATVAKRDGCDVARKLLFTVTELIAEGKR